MIRKIIIIIITLGILGFLSRLSYIRLFFPLWLIITILWGEISFFFRLSLSQTLIFAIALWITVMGALLFHSQFIAEQLSICIYILLFTVVAARLMKL